MACSYWCSCDDTCGYVTCCKRIDHGRKRAGNGQRTCGGCRGKPPRKRQKSAAALGAAAGGGGGDGPVQLVLPPQALEALDAIGKVKRGMRCALRGEGREAPGHLGVVRAHGMFLNLGFDVPITPTARCRWTLKL